MANAVKSRWCFATTVAHTVCEQLNESKLKRLRDHKYSATGTSYLEPMMQKFWNWLVQQCLPLWWSPNAMTLVGLVFNVFSCSLLVYYSPDGKQDLPAYALVLAAISLFIYQTLDACDGKQARRTGTNSPLGELFDHGCDAVSTIFLTLSVALTIQLGYYPTLMVMMCCGSSLLFYSAHWSTYVSGTLKFGRFDVTEMQDTIIFLYLLTAMFGSSLWNAVIPGLGISIKLVPIASTLLQQCLLFINDIKNILSGGAGKNGSTVAGTSILSPVISFSLSFLFALLIYSKSSGTVFVDNASIFIIMFGFVTAKNTNKLVVAHMSKSEMAKLDTIFIGPLLLFFNQYFNYYFDEFHVFLFAFAYTMIDYIYYSISTCQQLASYLNVYVLTITSKPPPVVASAVTSASSSNDEEHEDEEVEESERLGETQSLLSGENGSTIVTIEPCKQTTRDDNEVINVVQHQDTKGYEKFE